jgi:hypothetical protein
MDQGSTSPWSANPWAPPRNRRKRITPHQLAILTAAFDDNDTPAYEVREQIAHETMMSNREVQGERVAKLRTGRKEQTKADNLLFFSVESSLLLSQSGFRVSSQDRSFHVLC